MSWNPDTDLQFASPRTRPAAELLARVPGEKPARVIDLGCGPGNSTALLAARWPEARLEGLDSSEAMLAEARASGVAADWVLADLARWEPNLLHDVIYSNATLQWLPDHETLLPRLIGFVASGGVLAFQVPVNHNAPSHALMREVTSDPRWQKKLDGVREIHGATPAGVYKILKLYAVSLDIWTTEYLQVLEGEDAVYRWVSGTGLRPFVQALEGEEKDAFIAAYKGALDARLSAPRRRHHLVSVSAPVRGGDKP